MGLEQTTARAPLFFSLQLLVLPGGVFQTCEGPDDGQWPSLGGSGLRSRLDKWNLKLVGDAKPLASKRPVQEATLVALMLEDARSAECSAAP